MLPNENGEFLSNFEDTGLDLYLAGIVSYQTQESVLMRVVEHRSGIPLFSVYFPGGPRKVPAEYKFIANDIYRRFMQAKNDLFDIASDVFRK